MEKGENKKVTLARKKKKKERKGEEFQREETACTKVGRGKWQCDSAVTLGSTTIVE